MNICRMLLTILTLNSFVFSFDEFQKGVVKTDENSFELTETVSSNAYAFGTALLVHRSQNDEGVATFLQVANTTDLYSVSLNNNIYLINVSSDVIQNQWSLRRWRYLKYPSEISEELSSLGYQDTFAEIGAVSEDKNIGCIGSSPLRYGDVESDGNDELVLSIGGELIIFSPDYGRTVFSMLWYASDWVGLTNDYNSDLNGQPSLVDGESYQFASSVYPIDHGPHRGHRSYSKVFDGDFDSDGNYDLIVWQKVYRSNKVGEAVGFHVIRSEVKHFERDLDAQAESEAGITGEYLPQNTSEEDIQNWLAENDLTWSKGYPSKSECPGEEGQLIPEMHDPLLNDPDVLK